MSFVSVDPVVEQMVDVAQQHIDQATSMQRFGMLHPDTVLNVLTSATVSSKQYQRWTLLDTEVTVTPKRLNTFKTNLACVCCGKVGNIFLIERHRNDTETRYLNLYHVSDAEIVLMTVDHILPDSMGGRYDEANFQTMCRVCNLNKKNLMSIAEVELVRADPHKYAKSWMHMPFLHALLDLQLLIATTTGKHNERLMHVFDSYRKRIKFNTKLASAQKLTVDLQQAIREADPNFKEQSCTNVNRVAAQDSTEGSWSEKMKQWFVSVVRGLDNINLALFRSRTASKHEV